MILKEFHFNLQRKMLSFLIKPKNIFEFLDYLLNNEWMINNIKEELYFTDILTKY